MTLLQDYMFENNVEDVSSENDIDNVTLLLMGVTMMRSFIDYDHN